MKKIDLGQTITILANVGVIFGIVFLALELRQNNVLMQSQTRSDIAGSLSDMLLQAAFSDYIGETLAPEAVEGAQDVTQLRRTIFQVATFRIWENIYYQWTKGLYEDSEYEAEREVWASNINFSSIKSVFCSNRNVMSPGFRAELDMLLEEPC